MALLRFRLTDIRIRDPLVVLRSTLSLRVGSSGGISNFRIVAAPDSGEGLFHAFTGMVATPTPTTRRFHTEDTLLPHGWKRTIVKGHGGHLEGVYYSPEEVRHPTHPTMPMAHAAEFSEADGHQAVAMAYAPGDTMITPTTTPPQPQHFFSAPSHTSDRSYHVADVSMQIQSQFKVLGKDSGPEVVPEVTLIVVSEGMDDVEDGMTERPKLHVTYHYKDTLCKCTSALDSELCDRLCNSGTECKGHLCTTRDKHCKRAPHMRWTKCINQN